MMEPGEAETGDEGALAPEGYLAQASLEELRRYVCLDLARLSGVMPDKLVKAAREMERFLLGRSLRSADEHD
jgi:hypothetical protein